MIEQAFKERRNKSLMVYEYGMLRLNKFNHYVYKFFIIALIFKFRKFS